MLSRWAFGFVLLGLFVASAEPATAQDLRLESINRIAQSRVYPGKILALRATVSNPTEQEADGIVVAVVNGFPDRQCAKKVIVAPGKAASIDLYLNIPSELQGQENVEVQARLYRQEGGTERVQGTGRTSEAKLTLSLEKNKDYSAFFMDNDAAPVAPWRWPQAGPLMSYEWAIGTRIDAGTSRRVANMGSDPLPVNRADWNVIDNAIVAEENVLQDLAFVRSLRDFVESGGKAWVMLDRVSVDSLRPLLGAGQAIEVVDSTELTSFTVEVIGGTSVIAEEDRKVTSEIPLKMKRVLQVGGRVSHEIEGWPAAIWMKVGYGEILVTTLSPEGWIKARGNRGGENRDPMKVSAFESQLWSNSLALDINAPSLNPPLGSQVDYPIEMMGNPIVPRQWIATGLTSFCLMLLAIGLWRWWVGDMRLVGLIAPPVALVFAAGLVFAASFIRSDQPESVNRLQIVQVTEDGQSAIVREQAAVHLKSSADMKLQSNVDGVVHVDPQVKTGIQRFEKTQFHDWELQNQSWPPGYWRYSSEFEVPAEGLIATAILDESGLNVQLPDLHAQLEDAVLSFTRGGRMLCSGSGSNLTVDASQTVAVEQLIGGTLITSEQERRLSVYQQYFARKDRVQFVDHVLYGWTTTWPSTPIWSRDLQSGGSALVALPVQLLRPEAGKKIVVPRGLISIQADPRLTGQTLAFDGTTGMWVQNLTSPAVAELQFVLPPELVPFEAESMEIRLDMKAPQRNVSFSIVTDEGEVLIKELNEPSIPWSGTVTDARVLKDARDGILNFKLSVSERTDLQPGQSSTTVVQWQVEKLEASFSGSVASP